jgi:hypothetical protein
MFNYDEYGLNSLPLKHINIDEINLIDMSTGRKFDSDKLEYGLIPPLALKALVEVLTFGAQKYERGNWMHVPDAKRRYFDALQRHVWSWKEGEQIDPESGKHHLAHAMCCIAFLYEHDVKYSIDK